MTTIKDGKGRGYQAEVNKRQQLGVFASVEEEFKYISEKYGEAFIWTVETYDYAAADTILSVKNIRDEKNLHIYKIVLHGDTETEVEIHVPTASFTDAGTEVIGQALNRVLDKNGANYATAKADETGNTQGDVVERVRIKADTDYKVPLEGALILGENQAVCVDYATVGAEAHVSIWGYYKDKE